MVSMKHTFLALLCLLPVFARAEIVIERFTQTAKRTGEGVERTIRLKGWIIRDLDGASGASIATTVINGHKLYLVDRGTTRIFRTTISGKNGREYTVITQGVTETNETQVLSVSGLLYRGLNTTLQVSESRQLTYPRSLKGTAHRVELQDGYILDETTSTRTFSQTETRASNGLGDDVEAALAKIIQRLQQKGYVDAS
jgi:hypothetical protein